MRRPNFLITFYHRLITSIKSTDISQINSAKLILKYYFSMLHIEESLEKFEKLRHRQYWWRQTEHADVKQEEKETEVYGDYYDRVNSKHLLLVCPDGDVLKRRKHDCLLWAELLFTDPLWIEGIYKKS